MISGALSILRDILTRITNIDIDLGPVNRILAELNKTIAATQARVNKALNDALNKGINATQCLGTALDDIVKEIVAPIQECKDIVNGTIQIAINKTNGLIKDLQDLNNCSDLDCLFQVGNILTNAFTIVPTLIADLSRVVSQNITPCVTGVVNNALSAVSKAEEKIMQCIKNTVQTPTP